MTYTSGYVGTEIFNVHTPSTGPASRAMATAKSRFRSCTTCRATTTSPSPPRTLKSQLSRHDVITCCNTGFYDGINPPIFTGGTMALDWPLGVYVGAMEHSPSRLRRGAGDLHLGDDARRLRRARLRSPATPSKRRCAIRTQRSLKPLVSQISTASLRACGSALVSGAEAALWRCAAHEVVNEAQLLHDRRRDDERVEIGPAHGPIDAVHGDDEGRPGVDNPLDRTVCVRVEVELGEMRALSVDSRRDPEPERVRRLERVDDMQVMRPGFGEILPWMRGRISRDEALRPVGRRALLVMALERGLVIRESSPNIARHRSSLPPSRTRMSQ